MASRRLVSQASRSFSSKAETTRNILSGIPDKHAIRNVRIYKPTKVATQQGRGSLTQMWRMQFEKLEGGDRWTNPLMGWTSTGDPLSNMGMSFPSKEAAIAYAERNGYEFKVIEPEEEKQNVRPILPFKRAMVHHWRHEAPDYSGDSAK